MKGFQTLTLKKILKRHAENPQDKELHEQVENAGVDRKIFGRLIKKASETSPFDKKK